MLYSSERTNFEISQVCFQILAARILIITLFLLLEEFILDNESRCKSFKLLYCVIKSSIFFIIVFWNLLIVIIIEVKFEI